MPWFLSGWFRRPQASPRGRKNSSKPITRWARLSLEELEKRELFSANAWLPQRLNPVGGAAQYNVANTLFQPATGVIQPTVDLQSSSISVAGSFNLTDTGSYDLTLAQSGIDGSNTFMFTETGSVDFSLSISGNLVLSGYQPATSLLTQTVSLDWSFVEVDGNNQTVQNLSGSASFTRESSGAALDPFFWAGRNWYDLTADIASTNTLPVFSLNATSFTLDETGSESFTFEVSSGSTTLTGSASVQLADLLDQTGQMAYAVTSTRNFSQAQHGENSFTLTERGTFNNGSYALSCVAYSEQGSSGQGYSENGTLTQSGTVSASGNQSVGNSANNLASVESSGYQFSSASTHTYSEGSTDSYTLTKRGTFGGGSFNLNSVVYARAGEGSYGFSEAGTETSSGSFTANATLHAQDQYGYAGTLTNDSRIQGTGNFSRTLSFSRSESASGNFSITEEGAYANGSYQISGSNLSEAASGTFSRSQSDSYSEHASGTVGSSGAGNDSFSRNYQPVSTFNGTDSQSFATTLTYTRDTASFESVSESGNTSYSLTQTGSAAGGSYSLSSHVYRSGQSGTLTSTGSYSSSETGSASEQANGSGGDSSADTFGGNTGTGLGNYNFSSNSTLSYSSSTSGSSSETSSFTQSTIQVGSYAAGSYAFSSVVLSDSASRSWSQSGRETVSYSGSESRSQTTTGQSNSTTPYGGTTFGGLGQTTVTETSSTSFGQSSSDSYSGSGSSSFSHQQEGQFAGASYTFSRVAYQASNSAAGSSFRAVSDSFTQSGVSGFVNTSRDTDTTTSMSQMGGGVGTAVQTGLNTFSASGSSSSGQTIAFSTTENICEAGSFANGSYNLSSITYNTSGQNSWSLQQTTTLRDSGTYSWTGQETGNQSSSYLQNASFGSSLGTNNRTDTGNGTYANSSTETLTAAGNTSYTQHEEGTFSNLSYSASSVVYDTDEDESGTQQQTSTSSFTGSVTDSFTCSGTENGSGSDGVTSQSTLDAVTQSGQHTITQTGTGSVSQTVGYSHTSRTHEAGSSGMGSYNLSNVSFSESGNQSWSSTQAQTATQSGTYRISSLSTASDGSTLAYTNSSSAGLTSGTGSTTVTGTFNATIVTTESESGGSGDIFTGQGNYSNFSYNLSSVVYSSSDSYSAASQSTETSNFIESSSDSYTTTGTQNGSVANSGSSGVNLGTISRSGQSNSLQSSTSITTRTTSSTGSTSLYEDGGFAAGSYHLDSVAYTAISRDTWSLGRIQTANESGTDSWTEQRSTVQSGTLTYGQSTFSNLANESATESARETSTDSSSETYTEDGTSASTLSEMGTYAGDSYSLTSVVYQEQSSQDGTDNSISSHSHDISGNTAYSSGTSFSNLLGGLISGSGLIAVSGSGQESYTENSTSSSSFTDHGTGSSSLSEAGSYANGDYTWTGFASTRGSLDTFSTAQRSTNTLTQSSSQTDTVASAGSETSTIGLSTGNSSVSLSQTSTSSLTQFTGSTETRTQAGTSSSSLSEQGTYANLSYNLSSVVYRSGSSSQGTYQESAFLSFTERTGRTEAHGSSQGRLTSLGSFGFGSSDSYSDGATSSATETGLETVTRNNSVSSSFTLYEDGHFTDGTWTLSTVDYRTSGGETVSVDRTIRRTVTGTESVSSGQSGGSTSSLPSGLLGSGSQGSTSVSRSELETFTQTSNITLNEFGSTSHTLAQEGTYSGESYSFATVVYREQKSDQQTYDESSLTSATTSGSTSSSSYQNNSGSLVSGSSSISSVSEGSTSTGWSLESVARFQSAGSSHSLYEAGNWAGGCYSLSSVVYQANAATTISIEEYRTTHSEGTEVHASAGSNALGLSIGAQAGQSVASQGSSSLAQNGTNSFVNDTYQSRTEDAVSSYSLSERGTSDAYGISLQSIIYRASDSSDVSLHVATTVTLDGTVSQSGSDQSSGNNSATSGNSQDASGFSQSSNGSSSHSHSETTTFHRVEIDTVDGSSSGSSTLYQEGRYGQGSFTFGTLTLEQHGSSSTESGQTLTSLETGSSQKSESYTPSSSQGSSLSTLINWLFGSSHSVSQASGTFTSGSTTILSQGASSEFSLREAGEFAGGSVSLKSFTYDESGENYSSVEQTRTQSATDTQHIDRTTSSSVSGGDSDGNHSSQGSANFTSTVSSVSTFTLIADADMNYTVHSNGSFSQHSYSLSSYVYELSSTGGQTSSSTNLETANSTGTNGGTQQLGINEPFQGTGSFTEFATRGGTATDSRSYTFDLYAAGTAANSKLSLSSISLVETSGNEQSLDRSGNSIETVTGTNNNLLFGGPYTGTSMDCFSEQSTKGLSSSVTERGTFGSSMVGMPPSYNLGVTMTLSGGWSSSGSKGAAESFSGSTRGSNNLSASGSDSGCFSLSAVGNYAGNSYTFSTVTLTGNASGSFSQTEVGAMRENTLDVTADTITYSHGKSMAAVKTVYEVGSYGGGSFSFSTYNVCETSGQTMTDQVANAASTMTRYDQDTTLGSGQTGTLTRIAQGTYTYASMPGDHYNLTSTETVALWGPRLDVPKPESWVLPTSTMAEAGGVAEMQSGVEVFGGKGAVLPRPDGNEITLLELLGPEHGWSLRLNSQGGSTQLEVVEEALDQPTMLGGAAFLGMAMQMSKEMSLSGSVGLLWSWLGGAGAAVASEVTPVHAAGSSMALMAYRSGDPLSMQSGRVWEAMTQDMAWWGAGVSWSWVRRGVNGAVGFVDALAGASSQGTARMLGLDRFVDHDSQWYQYGEYAGEVVVLALTILDGMGRGGQLVSMFWKFRAAVQMEQARKELLRGHVGDAAWMATGALLTLGHDVKGCGLQDMFGESGRWMGIGMGVVGVVHGVQQAGDRFSRGDDVGGMLSLMQGGADAYAMTRSCFTGEMLLDTEHGRKRADAIVVGDRLWSRPEDDPEGLLALKEVEEVFVRVAPVLNVHVAGQILRTTAEHPFWVEGKGWLPAWSLQIGDRLRTRSGRLVAVEGVADSGEVTTVYNWQVADYHTYYVSATEAGVSVWAHNAQRYTATERKQRLLNKTKYSREATRELRRGKSRTPEQNAEARVFFKSNKQLARDLWSERTGGKKWPTRNGKPVLADHRPRSLKNGGDPLHVEPNRGRAIKPKSANNQHLVTGADGLTDQQIWGAEGGKAKAENARRRAREARRRAREARRRAREAAEYIFG